MALTYRCGFVRQGEAFCFLAQFKCFHRHRELQPELQPNCAGYARRFAETHSIETQVLPEKFAACSYPHALLPTSTCAMTRQARQQAASASSQALLDSISSIKDVQTAEKACLEIRQHLEPVLSTVDGQKGYLSVRCQRLAKTYLSFCVQLLKSSMLKINSSSTSALQSAYVQLAALGLDGLSAMRGCLKGRPQEVEVQRYMLLRKLVSLKLYQQALQQAWLLYTSLCCQCWQASDQAYTRDTPLLAIQPLPAPEPTNTEVGSLIVGTVLNLLISIVEQGGVTAHMSMVRTFIEAFSTIMGWLRSV